MQAIVRDRYGDAGDVLRLEETAEPEIEDDEVLVRVHAAGVDRGTWHLVAGLPYVVRLAGYGIHTPKAKIRVPGLDVAGTVETVGRNVTDLAPGDAVFGTSNGSFAEYASAAAASWRRSPNLSFEQAAAVPVSALTALHGLHDHGRCTKDSTC